jgi:hypothetical protein
MCEFSNGNGVPAVYSLSKDIKALNGQFDEGAVMAMNGPFQGMDVGAKGSVDNGACNYESINAIFPVQIMLQPKESTDLAIEIPMEIVVTVKDSRGNGPPSDVTKTTYFIPTFTDTPANEYERNGIEKNTRVNVMIGQSANGNRACIGKLFGPADRQSRTQAQPDSQTQLQQSCSAWKVE